MNQVPEFREFGKIFRLKRDIIVTEKLDGTNASILIADDSLPFNSDREVPFLVGSRSRWILPESDNHGFARWAYENAEELRKLGPGHHFGEWWGQGVQRRYGLTEKRFSLFNVTRWKDQELPRGVTLVPTLYSGTFSEEMIEAVLKDLKDKGSVAAPGFMDPEGIVIFHDPSRYLFKITLKNDGLPKSLVKEQT